MMKNVRITQLLVIIACLSILALPILNVVIVSPAFTNFLKGVGERELVKIASKVATTIDTQEDFTDESTFAEDFIQNIETDRELLNLTKIKIFTRSGKIIHSTDATEIGQFSEKDFFKALVVDKETRSLLKVEDKENPGHEVFLIETYVPIVKNDRTIGILEVYYDMTETRQILSRVSNKTNVIVFFTSLSLLAAMLGCAFLTRRSELQREIVEKEKDLLIEELSSALNEIKTLRGILPLCSYCKKIRDDSGYWEQVDVYIRQHSDAEISHGICPECAMEHHPELYKKAQDRKANPPSEGSD